MISLSLHDHDEHQRHYLQQQQQQQQEQMFFYSQQQCQPPINNDNEISFQSLPNINPLHLHQQQQQHQQQHESIMMMEYGCYPPNHQQQAEETVYHHHQHPRSTPHHPGVYAIRYYSNNDNDDNQQPQQRRIVEDSTTRNEQDVTSAFCNEEDSWDPTEQSSQIQNEQQQQQQHQFIFSNAIGNIGIGTIISDNGTADDRTTQNHADTDDDDSNERCRNDGYFKESNRWIFADNNTRLLVLLLLLLLLVCVVIVVGGILVTVIIVVVANDESSAPSTPLSETDGSDACAYLSQPSSSEPSSSFIPDPFIQCACDGRISINSIDMKERASLLRSILLNESTVPNEALTHNGNDHCEPRKLALLWLSYSSLAHPLTTNADTRNQTAATITARRLQARFVLAFFYATFVGKEWKQRTHHYWLTPKHECQWLGVECDNEGNVVGLSLQGMHLRGIWELEMSTLLESIGLKSLRLPKNDINGELPLFEGLQILNVQQNSFSTSIPDNIGTFGSLQELLLGLNDMYGTIPRSLYRLTNLRQLNLQGNRRLRGSFEISSYWTQMTKLSIEETQLQGLFSPKNALWLRSLTNLTNLNTMVVHFAALTGTIPETLIQLTRLKTLSLFSNQLTGTIPTVLGNLTSLETVLLLGENDLSGTIPIFLACS